MNTTRMDQYICLDVDAIIVDEMKEIISMNTSHLTHKEDIVYTAKAMAAAKVILEYYQVPGADPDA